MKRFEVVNYMKSLRDFFDQNPNDLYDLIGGLDVEKFYIRIESICEKNFDDTGLVEVTQDQIINTVIDLYEEMNNKVVRRLDIDTAFQNTNIGLICLN